MKFELTPMGGGFYELSLVDEAEGTKYPILRSDDRDMMEAASKRHAQQNGLPLIDHGMVQ